MISQPTLTMGKISFLDIFSWLFGALLIAIGIVNTFWGNDPFFGVFILLASQVYYPWVPKLVKAITGITIPRIAKIGLGLFILWAALGVGELFDKVDMMLADLRG